MNFRPLRNQIVVKRLAAPENISKGGIQLITPLDLPPEGVVLAAGPGKYNDKGIFVVCDVKVGDRILFGKHAGTQHTIEDQEVLIMADIDVLGVVIPITAPATVETPVAETTGC